MISTLERAVLKVINEQQCISSELLFDVTTALAELTPLPLLGCKEHSTALTHKIIAFFLTTRMFFIAKQSSKNDNIEKEMTRERRKLAKLSNASAAKSNGVCVVAHPETVKSESCAKNTRKRKLSRSNSVEKKTEKKQRQRKGKENNFANK